MQNADRSISRASHLEHPQSLRDVLKVILHRFAEERAFFVSGAVGVGLGVLGLIVALVHGPIIQPEGVLRKAISFDLALGIYVLTLLFFIPLANFSERSLRRWRGWHIVLVYIAYAIENIQIARGLDPRFSRAGSPADNLLGGFFFLIALTLFVLFLILAIGIFKKRKTSEHRLLLIATRYAFASTIVAYGAGFWMSFKGGPTTGAASILPLHAIGFHGLQAVPLVALLLSWSGTSTEKARHWVHQAGLAWLGAGLAIALQTASGRQIVEFSALPVLAVAFLLVWLWLAANVFLKWTKTPPQRLEART